MFLLKVTCIKPDTQYTGMIPTTIDALCGGWGCVCAEVRGGGVEISTRRRAIVLALQIPP